MKEGCEKKISLIGKDIAKLNKSVSNFWFQVNLIYILKLNF